MFARKNVMKTVLLLVLAGVVAGMVACATPSAAEPLDAMSSGELTGSVDQNDPVLLPMATDTPSGSSEAAVTASGEDVWGEDAEILDEASLWQDAPAPSEATTLSVVNVNPVEGGVLVHLTANGVIGNTESFVLDNPDRLVIDLLGMTSTVKVGRVKSDSAMVSSIRIGAHADKVRIVMDGGSEAMGFKGKQIMPASDGLWVAVGEGEVVASALSNALDASDMAWAATQSPAAAATLEVAKVEDWEVETVEEDVTDVVEAADVYEAVAVQEDAAVVETMEVLRVVGRVPVTVFGIEYETDLEEGVERIAVVASDATSHDWLAPDAETVVVRISNAVMADEAGGRIATREGGPLSLISAFEQPEVDPSEVRIVVKRTAHLAPEISTVGSNLIIEFPIEDAIEEENVVAVASEVVEMEEVAVAEVATVDPTEPTMPVMEDMTGAMELPLVEQVPMAAPIARVESIPASIASPVSMPPASLEPPAAIEVLQEGGLIDGKDYRGRRISLDFKDVAISDVLRLIAEVSDLNIISGDEVSGNVSIRLVDVPWDQALDVILLTKGLGFVRVGNVLRIAPSDVLAQEEEVRLQERRAKEKLEDLVVKLIPVNYGDV
ncbi:MAG: AMIN domain-containing protein, partial [Myxococcota bacterium]|nr:AMIN domain-containing protein [Myxococcota bacterium]